MCSQFKSDLHIFYLDGDGTLGGAFNDDHQRRSIDQLILVKSEISSNNNAVIQDMLIAVSGLQVTNPR